MWKVLDEPWGCCRPCPPGHDLEETFPGRKGWLSLRTKPVFGDFLVWFSFSFRSGNCLCVQSHYWNLRILSSIRRVEKQKTTKTSNLIFKLEPRDIRKQMRLFWIAVSVYFKAIDTQSLLCILITWFPELKLDIFFFIHTTVSLRTRHHGHHIPLAKDWKELKI